MSAPDHLPELVLGTRLERVRVYLRVAGQLDSCGTGLLAFAQLHANKSLGSFWRPTDYDAKLGNLHSFVYRVPQCPSTPSEHETCKKFSPIFQTDAFRSSSFLLAYNMAQGVKYEVHVKGSLTRIADRLAPHPPQLPLSRDRVQQQGRPCARLSRPEPLQPHPDPPAIVSQPRQLGPDIGRRRVGDRPRRRLDRQA